MIPNLYVKVFSDKDNGLPDTRKVVIDKAYNCVIEIHGYNINYKYCLLVNNRESIYMYRYNNIDIPIANAKYRKVGNNIELYFGGNSSYIMYAIHKTTDSVTKIPEVTRENISIPSNCVDVTVIKL